MKIVAMVFLLIGGFFLIYNYCAITRNIHKRPIGSIFPFLATIFIPLGVFLYSGSWILAFLSIFLDPFVWCCIKIFCEFLMLKFK